MVCRQAVRLGRNGQPVGWLCARMPQVELVRATARSSLRVSTATRWERPRQCADPAQGGRRRPIKSGRAAHSAHRGTAALRSDGRLCRVQRQAGLALFQLIIAAARHDGRNQPRTFGADALDLHQLLGLGLQHLAEIAEVLNELCASAFVSAAGWRETADIPAPRVRPGCPVRLARRAPACVRGVSRGDFRLPFFHIPSLRSAGFIIYCKKTFANRFY